MVAGAEEPFFFPTEGGKRLFGILHRSRIQHPSGRKTAIVYCHPLFEEKINSHRVMVSFARRAAAEGCDVLRFDYFGDGESDGLFEEAGLSSRIRDVAAAVRQVRERCGAERVFVLGLRVGAALGILSCAGGLEVSGLIAWAPVLDVKAYLFDMLRSNLSAQLLVHKKIVSTREALVERLLAGRTVNVDGYELGPALYGEAAEYASALQEACVAGPVLVVDFKERPSPELAIFLRQGLASLRAVHEVPFWMPQHHVYPPCRQLFDLTLQWIAIVDDNRSRMEP